MMELIHGDMLQEIKKIPDKSIDMILNDPPYGTTKAPWDIKIDIDSMWTEYKRVIKPSGAILLFSQMPFSAELIMANAGGFRYEWIWEKSMPVGYLNANRMPLRCHELILVFYDSLPKFHPQYTQGKKYTRIRSEYRTELYGDQKRSATIDKATRNPRDVIKFSNALNNKRCHPTEKPTDLLRYLIRSYTDPGETILDPTMGSGSCAEAAYLEGRNFIGIEKDGEFYGRAVNRMKNLEYI